jgi:hypothetical protein
LSKLPLKEKPMRARINKAHPIAGIDNKKLTIITTSIDLIIYFRCIAIFIKGTL